MSSGFPDPSASQPIPGEEEGNARRRIAYSREFLISVGTSSEACRRLPVGFDASKLRSAFPASVELGLVDTGSRGRYVAPFGRWGSGDPESRSDHLDRHPGNQCRDSWRSNERDGLLGSDAFPRIPSYAGPLASNGQGCGHQLTRNTGGYQPTRQYKTPPDSHKNVDLINTVTFGSFENWNKDRVEEEKKRRASFDLLRKEQHQDLQENKKAPDSDKENLSDGIMSLLEDSGGKRDAPTKSDKQGGLKVSSLSKEDAIKAAPLLPTPTTDPLKPLDFTNGIPQKRLQIEQLNTENIMESSICAQRLSGGGILGSGHEETLSPKLMVPSSHSKCGPFDMRTGTVVVECHKPTFSGSSEEGASFDKDGLEIHLPEEDTLFSVNDFSYTQNTDQWSAAEGANLDKEGVEIHLPEEDDLFSVNDFSYTQNTGQWSAAEWARSEGLPKDNVADINYRFQSLDVLGSQSHDQIDPNNLYHLFETRPNAEFPKRNADTMFLPSRPSDGNRQAPFHMPKAIHHGAYCPFPQDMKSMDHVLRAPAGPCAGLAAPHHTLPHIAMPASFLPPQGFPRCAPLPQPVHCTPNYRTEMTGANSFQMHHRLPGYGEKGMMMAGPGTEFNQAGAFGRSVQMELRARSRQMNPQRSGSVHGFYGQFRC